MVVILKNCMNLSDFNSKIVFKNLTDEPMFRMLISYFLNGCFLR